MNALEMRLCLYTEDTKHHFDPMKTLSIVRSKTHTHVRIKEVTQ